MSKLGKLCLLSFACMATMALGFLSAAAADQNKVFRAEVHPVATLTLSDNDMLSGKKEGKADTIAGALNTPTKSKDKLPAVIALHGSSGPGATNGPTDQWVRELNALGVATFALDALSGRGLTSLGGNQAALRRLAMIVDSYRALGVLAQNKRIDPNRIALLGLSRGGHGFDLGFLNGRGTIDCNSCQTARLCKLAESAEGVVMNPETSKPFAYDDACVQKGTTIAYHPTEGPKARAKAAEIIKTVFGLE
jgi:hypothetical protein